MLNPLRVHVSRVTDPVGRWLVTHGVSPDVVTVAGTVGTAASAVVFLARGHLFLGALLATVFVLFDMIDGAMARARGHSTPFGAVLDSTCDRIADGAIFGAVVYWLAVHGRTWGAAAGLVALVAGQVVSY
ncbi:MAG: CDP-diacylglycerol---glycerol-3-phosphate 3-phosphatidyltransferase, partial [Pseudonocardiales bacterium]|nr:CDP-diacylglycerol---glycerol-3-phosphate 3-phosphatidyltransferase [Pseudonocardiales bacterium]